MGVRLGDGLIAIGVQRGAAQAVAGLARSDPDAVFDETRLLVLVGAGPASARRPVNHTLEVADRVVCISLGVVAHRSRIVGLRRPHEGIIAVVAVGWGELKRRLVDVLAPGGFDEAVDGIVGVMADWLDGLPGVDDRRQRRIGDLGDVA